MEKNKNRLGSKQIVALVCAVALVLTMVAGVIGNSSSDLNSGTVKNKSNIDESANGFEKSMVAEATSNNMSGAETNDICKFVDSSSHRYVTKTATLNVSTKNYKNFVKLLEGELKLDAGYIQSSNVYNYADENESTNGYMVIKIPTDKLDVFINFIESKASVDSKSVSIDDITEDYVDTESRLNNLQKEEQTLIALLGKAESLSDTIAIQDKLTDVQSQIEYYTSMLNRLKSEVEYSTVNIEIKEVSRESEHGEGFWHDVKNGFIDSLYAIGRGFRIIFVWLISNLPFIAIIIVLGILIVKLVKTIKIKKQKKATPNGSRGDDDGGQTNS